MLETVQNPKIVYSIEQLEYMFNAKTVSNIFETILNSIPNRCICLKHDFAEEQILVGNMLDILYRHQDLFQNIETYKDLKKSIIDLSKTECLEFETVTYLNVLSKIHLSFTDSILQITGQAFFSCVPPSDILQVLIQDYGLEIDGGWDLIYDKYHELFEIELKFLKKDEFLEKN